MCIRDRSSSLIKSSFNIYISGFGCCKQEIIASTGPVYDISRFGISVVSYPESADVLIVQGFLNRKYVKRLIEIYDACLLYTSSEGFDFEEVIILSTNIDDMAPEHIGYITEKILQEKALDVWTEPVFMKKDRQAVQLNILCKSSEEVKLSRMIFEETTTLGIRRTRAGRYFLERKEDFVKLPYGEVGIKLGYLKGEIITCSPEYESCRQLARKTKKPLKDIYRDVGRFFSMR